MRALRAAVWVKKRRICSAAEGAVPPAGRTAAAAAPPCAAASILRSVSRRRLGSNDMPSAVRAASSSGFVISVRSDAVTGAGAAIPVCAAFTAGSKAVPVSSTKNLELTEKTTLRARLERRFQNPKTSPIRPECRPCNDGGVTVTTQ